MLVKRFQKRIVSGLAVLAILFNALSPTLAWAFTFNEVKNIQGDVIWMSESSTEADFEVISAMSEFDQWVEVCTTQNNQWWAMSRSGEVIAKSNQRPAHVPPHLFQHTNCEYCSHHVNVLSIPSASVTSTVVYLPEASVTWRVHTFIFHQLDFSWTEQAPRAPPLA